MLKVTLIFNNEFAYSESCLDVLVNDYLSDNGRKYIYHIGETKQGTFDKSSEEEINHLDYYKKMQRVKLMDKSIKGGFKCVL